MRVGIVPLSERTPLPQRRLVVASLGCGQILTTKRPVIPVPMSVFVLISSVLPQATDILDKAGNVSS